MMKKIMKFALILLFLVLFTVTPPASATRHINTYIYEPCNYFAYQGDNIDVSIEVCYLNRLGEHRVHGRDDNSVYVKIYDANNVEVAHYNVKHHHTWGDGIKINTSNLKPGEYRMTIYFIGVHKKHRIFNPCNVTEYLTVCKPK